MGISEFLEEYFIKPIYHDTFNPVNTLVYAGLFMVLIYTTLRIFGRLSIKFDRGFYSYFLLYILLGSVLGALRDTHNLASPLFSTVGIYFLIFTMLVGSIIVGKLAEARLGVSHRAVPLATAVLGLGVLLLNYAPTGVRVGPLILILGLALPPTIILAVGLRRLGLRVLNKDVNIAILLAHMLDASSTYVGVVYLGFREKFFLTSYVMQVFTPFSIFVLKAVAVIAVLYALDKSEEDMMVDAIKAGIFTLGLAPALRNTFLSMFQ